MLKFIFSLIAGIATYIIFGKFIYGSILLSFLFGLAVFIIIRRVMKSFFNKTKKEEVDSKVASPKSEQAKKAAEEGLKTIIKIRNQTRMIKDNSVAHKIQDICKVGIDIFEDIKKNPEDLKKIKTFTNYYLDSTEKIINQYVDFSNRKEKTPEIEKSLENVEGLLDQIKKTFDKQLASLLENDLLNLDVELSVLKKTMKYEG